MIKAEEEREALKQKVNPNDSKKNSNNNNNDEETKNADNNNKNNNKNNDNSKTMTKKSNKKIACVKKNSDNSNKKICKLNNDGSLKPPIIQSARKYRKKSELTQRNLDSRPFEKRQLKKFLIEQQKLSQSSNDVINMSNNNHDNHNKKKSKNKMKYIPKQTIPFLNTRSYTVGDIPKYYNNNGTPGYYNQTNNNAFQFNQHALINSVSQGNLISMNSLRSPNYYSVQPQAPGQTTNTLQQAMIVPSINNNNPSNSIQYTTHPTMTRHASYTHGTTYHQQQ